MDLRKKILNLDEGLSIYSQLLKDEETILIPFAISQYVTVCRICELLPEYLADLRRNECKESLSIEFDLMLDLIHEDMASLQEVTLPEPLATPEGRNLLEKARQAGYLNDKYQPTISRAKAALLSNEIAERLEIQNKWKVFEQFWNRQNMYKDYYDAVYQKQSPDFQKSLYKLFG